MTENIEVGYRGATACVAAGISYRQLDYWARTGLVEPGVRGAAGSGSSRLYGFRDILVLKIVKRLLDTGVSLQNLGQLWSICALAAYLIWKVSL
jgi:DNA-binding transcriptional MerR regulator